MGVGIIHSLCAERYSRNLEFVSMKPFYGKLTFAAIYLRAAGNAQRVRPELFRMLESLTQERLET